jgi:hypothetical protein
MRQPAQEGATAGSCWAGPVVDGPHRHVGRHAVQAGCHDNSAALPGRAGAAAVFVVRG